MVKILDSLWEREIKKRKGERNFLIVFLSICAVILTVMLLFTYVFFNVWVDGRSMEGTLQTGDVVVANYTKQPTYKSIVIISGKMSNGGDLIKRVIAMEGDTVTIENGVVYLKKKGELVSSLLDEPYAKGLTLVNNSEASRTYVIGKNEFFFLGDNRQHSSDSRYYGTCTREQIVGVVEEYSIATRKVRKACFDAIYQILEFLGINVRKTTS